MRQLYNLGIRYILLKIVSIFIQTTIRTEAVSRKATSAPRRLPFSTSLPPKLPSAQPLIRTSVKDQVSTDRKIERKKNGKDVVIRFVSTAPPRPFKTKVNIYISKTMCVLNIQP